MRRPASYPGKNHLYRANRELGRAFNPDLLLPLFRCLLDHVIRTIKISDSQRSFGEIGQMDSKENGRLLNQQYPLFFRTVHISGFARIGGLKDRCKWPNSMSGRAKASTSGASRCSPVRSAPTCCAMLQSSDPPTWPKISCLPMMTQLLNNFHLGMKSKRSFRKAQTSQSSLTLRDYLFLSSSVINPALPVLQCRNRV